MTVRDEFLGAFHGFGFCLETKSWMAGEFEDPETAMDLDGPQEACAQRQQRALLHCSKVSVNDDMAGSFGRPYQLFEAGSGYSIVNHLSAQPFCQFENRPLDVLSTGDYNPIRSKLEQCLFFCLGVSWLSLAIS